jgi:hypothetical protein
MYTIIKRTYERKMNTKHNNNNNNIANTIR